MDQETDFETITKTGMIRNVDMQAMAGGIMTDTGTTMRRTLVRVPRDGEMKVDGDTEEGGAGTGASEVRLYTVIYWIYVMISTSVFFTYATTINIY